MGILSGMAEHIRIFESPSKLAEAAELLLADPDLDIVVTQGFGDRTSGFAWKNDAEIYEAVPELHDVNDVTAEWWSNNGPNGFCIESGLTNWFKIWQSTRPHIDYPLARTKDDRLSPRWFGTLTGTMMHVLEAGASSIFYAQNPTLPLDPDVIAAWSEDEMVAYLQVFMQQQEVSEGSLPLRTSHTQSKGEILFFKNFPSPTLHCAEVRGGLPNRTNRLAQIITGFVTRADG